MVVLSFQFFPLYDNIFFILKRRIQLGQGLWTVRERSGIWAADGDRLASTTDVWRTSILTGGVIIDKFTIVEKMDVPRRGTQQ